MSRRRRNKDDAYSDLWANVETLIRPWPERKPTTDAEVALHNALVRINDLHIPVHAVDEIAEIIDATCRICNERETTQRAIA